MKDRYKFKFSIIMPVYNVELYLAEAIESVVCQTIGFNNNCEIILIDDGSTDSSGDVCKRYKKKYPNNIRYIWQENSGPGAARNRGIKQSKGRYISLLDPDDKLSSDTLSQVYDFFEDTGRDVDVVAIKYQFFGARDGSRHPLNFKFDFDRIIDLEEDFTSIQMSAATAFFRSSVLKDALFNEAVGRYSEDAHLMGRLLLSKRKYGVLAGPTYWYRKRDDESSSLDMSEYDEFWYFETTIRVWKDLITYSKDRNDYVPKFIQYMVVYEIYHRLRQKNRRILDDSNKLARYMLVLGELLYYVDESIILVAKAPIEFKVLMLSMKTGRSIHDSLIIDTNGDYAWESHKIYKKQNIKFSIDNIAVNDDTVTITGWHSGFLIKGINFFAKSNDIKKALNYEEFRPKIETYSLGRVIYRRNAFTVKLSLGEDVNRIQFGVYCNGQDHICNIYKFHPGTGLSVDNAYIYKYDNHTRWLQQLYNRKTLIIKQSSLRNLVKREIRYVQSVYRQRGVLVAFMTPFIRLYGTRSVGAPLRLAGKMIGPSRVKVSNSGTLSYGDLFSSPKKKDFYLSKPTSLEGLKVASIMDDFTYSAFSPECSVLQLTPDGWREELNRQEPNLLFVESAWRGKDDLWSNKVVNPSDELKSIVNYCREKSIPTIFWNKEDPAHTFNFIQTASMFDYIFTTDAGCINTYREVLGHSRIYLLPFATQPRDHNPIEKYDRKNKFNFAGSYYPKYQERNRNFKAIVKAATAFRGLDIYDRNYNKDLVGGIHRFEGEYKQYVKGNLPYSEIDKAYKGYKYAITLNTIKNSSTMFARRAFELMASNTITVGNYSKGIINTLGELTVSSDSGYEILERLRDITKTKHRESAFRLLGLRKVLSEHSYKERLDRIVKVVFCNYTESVSHSDRGVCFIGYAKDNNEVVALKDIFDRQKIVPTNRVIVSTTIQDDQDVISYKEIKKQQKATNLIGDNRCVVVFSPESYYGNNYVTDLMLATQYSDKAIIGKASYYKKNKSNNKLTLLGKVKQYQENIPIQIDRSLMSPGAVMGMTAHELIGQIKSKHIYKTNSLSIDGFSYTPVGLSLSGKDKDYIDGLLDIDTGIDIGTMYKRADAITNNRKKVFSSVALRRLRLVKTQLSVEEL